MFGDAKALRSHQNPSMLNLRDEYLNLAQAGGGLITAATTTAIKTCGTGSRSCC